VGAVLNGRLQASAASPNATTKRVPRMNFHNPPYQTFASSVSLKSETATSATGYTVIPNKKGRLARVALWTSRLSPRCLEFHSTAQNPFRAWLLSQGEATNGENLYRPISLPIITPPSIRRADRSWMRLPRPPAP
jgi:hypothetical protein